MWTRVGANGMRILEQRAKKHMEKMNGGRETGRGERPHRREKPFRYSSCPRSSGSIDGAPARFAGPSPAAGKDRRDLPPSRSLVPRFRAPALEFHRQISSRKNVQTLGQHRRLGRRGRASRGRGARGREREAAAAAAAAPARAEAQNFPSLRESVSAKPKKKRMSVPLNAFITNSSVGSGGSGAGGRGW
ncbi:hypothetical protein NL676_032530 [Syzygium grande]|nr:hypothetical protein NL676_032530 [Syzygium grande]